MDTKNYGLRIPKWFTPLILILVISLTACTSQESSSSLPPVASSSIQSESAPASVVSSSDEPQQESKPGIALNPDVVRFIGQTNAIVKQANGTVCKIEIMSGGSPVANYMGQNVNYPIAFWLLANQEEMMAVWDKHLDETGKLLQENENFWPDSYEVDMIEVEGDFLRTLFSTSEPVTYTMLQEAYGQAPALESTEAYGGGDWNYTVDTYSAKYENIEGYTLGAVFTKNGNEYELYVAKLSLA